VPKKETFIVLRDSGAQGWTLAGNPCDNILDAVKQREDVLTNGGGGKTMVCEVIDPLDAYRRADYMRKD
jgi:hypothetical protein